MSLDKLLLDVVRDEVARAIRPLESALNELQSQSAILAGLQSVLRGGPARRGPAPKPVKVAPVKAGRKARRRPEPVETFDGEGGPRNCALEDCGRPARSKGYCAAHYQKYRMLQKTGRLPEDWTEFAAEGSVKNITLPRGRAGAKALADAKRKSKD